MRVDSWKKSLIDYDDDDGDDDDEFALYDEDPFPKNYCCFPFYHVFYGECTVHTGQTLNQMNPNLTET